MLSSVLTIINPTNAAWNPAWPFGVSSPDGYSIFG